MSIDEAKTVCVGERLYLTKDRLFKVQENNNGILTGYVYEFFSTYRCIDDIRTFYNPAMLKRDWR